ncbi:hypothetical protein [Methylorubrum extorquens]|uniref:Uncharacterized protein n=1 Tax=Methylorubrum extorquens (strain CM4 / NCIMB 13688) TaxID=440085 RepID=B7L2V1_METC4|nr:hypothetical protein [Methylorubrum extorquens]ACK86159.1 hypothetical protein Mchl_5401 [Methylorubrum extorquens CM4]
MRTTLIDTARHGSALPSGEDAGRARRLPDRRRPASRRTAGPGWLRDDRWRSPEGQEAAADESYEGADPGEAPLPAIETELLDDDFDDVDFPGLARAARGTDAFGGNWALWSAAEADD